MDWLISYYSERVQRTIDHWPIGVRAVYARITERMVTFGPNIGMPFTHSMGDSLFEIRAKGKEGIGRAFFCIAIGNEIIVLHAFIKKSDKTPLKELTIARRRLKEIRDENT